MLFFILVVCNICITFLLSGNIYLLNGILRLFEAFNPEGKCIRQRHFNLNFILMHAYYFAVFVFSIILDILIKKLLFLLEIVIYGHEC